VVRPFIGPGLLLTVVALGAGALGCTEEDYGPVRNPGGGGGGNGTGQGGDARQLDAAGSDGGFGEVSGLICVVTDLRLPDACPTGLTQVGVAVAVRGTSVTATSGSDGRFTVAASGATAVLDAAAGSTTPEPAIVPVAGSGPLVHTPVVTQVAWAQVLGGLGKGVPDGGGAIVAYVDDTSGPGSGVAFEFATGSSIAPFYDSGTAFVQGGGTGAAGVALFVDVPEGNAALVGVAPDQRVARATVPVVADAITFVRLRLVMP